MVSMTKGRKEEANEMPDKRVTNSCICLRDDCSHKFNSFVEPKYIVSVGYNRKLGKYNTIEKP